MTHYNILELLLYNYIYIYNLLILHYLSNTFYAILCVKFVREVRYFTSKLAIFSLFALVVRKVTGGEIIE